MKKSGLMSDEYVLVNGKKIYKIKKIEYSGRE
jgi:hypothetical protein